MKNTTLAAKEALETDEEILVARTLLRAVRWLESMPEDERLETALGLCLLDAGHDGIAVIHRQFVEPALQGTNQQESNLARAV